MIRIIVKYCVYLIICGAIFSMFYPLWQRANENPHYVPCQGNLKQIALAIFEYAQDNNENLPSAIFPNKTIGWANAVQPYLKDYAIFQCPNEGNPQQKVPRPDQPGFTDYWMNLHLSGINEGKVTHVESTFMLGEGDGASPQSTASYAIDHFTVPWLQSSGSPIKRHLGGANYAFADGHVKWLKPDEVARTKASDKIPVYDFQPK